MKRTWRCVAAVTASCGLIAAACGGDDDDEGSDSTEAPAGTDASAATEAPAETEAPADTTVLAEGTRPADAAQRSMSATYHRPFIAHGSIAPSAAVGLARDCGLEIWSHSQSVYNLRSEIARELGMVPEQLVVRHVEGAGCYGHNGADDAAMDALLAGERLSTLFV